MQKVNRALLHALPLPVGSNAARTFRAELAGLVAEGLAEITPTDFQRTPAGNVAINPPGRTRREAPDLLRRSSESGEYSSVGGNPDSLEATLMVRVPQRVIAALDERAGDTTRSEYVRELLETILFPRAKRVG